MGSLMATNVRYGRPTAQIGHDSRSEGLGAVGLAACKRGAGGSRAPLRIWSEPAPRSGEPAPVAQTGASQSGYQRSSSGSIGSSCSSFACSWSSRSESRRFLASGTNG